MLQQKVITDIYVKFCQNCKQQINSNPDSIIKKNAQIATYYAEGLSTYFKW